MNGNADGGTRAPTWDQALSVWWLITWRSLALLFVFNFALYLVIVLIGGFGGGPGAQGARALADHPGFNLLVAAVYIAVGIWVVRMALAKRYRGFRVRLEPAPPPGAEPDARM